MSERQVQKVKIKPRMVVNGVVDGIRLCNPKAIAEVWEVVMGNLTLYVGQGIKRIIVHKEHGQTLVVGAVTLMMVLTMFFASIVVAQVYVATTETAAMRASLVRRVIEGGYMGGTMSNGTSIVACERADYTARLLTCTTEISVELFGVSLRSERVEELP